MKRKALVVGIDDYHSTPLRGCVNDAGRMKEILAPDSDNFETKSLINSDATRASIRECIRWLLSDTDVSLLYFAGHGWRSADTTYLVTHDYIPNDEGIDLEWLANAANRLAHPDQTVIFILDCCHSGDASVRGSVSSEYMNAQDVPAINGRGRVLLAACRGPESALEYEVKGTLHGAFTHHLCEALTGAAADHGGNVTLNAVFDYVTISLRGENRQIPVMKGDQEGSIILRQGVRKIGNWSRPSTTALSVTDALVKAEQLLSQAQYMFNKSNSSQDWKTNGYLEACKTFLPILNWFKRRAEYQHELLTDSTFKQAYDTCQLFLSRLCAVTQGIRLPNGSISKRIGSGSFGTVWRVFDSIWKEEVCIKIFHPHDLSDTEKVGRFRRGYDAMSQLDHPNIVKVLELSEIPYGFYMQYIDGANLRDYNPGAYQDPDQIVHLLLGIAETLKHAHGRGVIHRDVKPENILVKYLNDGSVEPFLTDFDLAWFSTATQVTQVAGFGSHFYAAPEQMDSPQAGVSHEPTVDTYSFGQLCFFAICGRDPLAFNHEGNTKALSEELGKRWNDSDASKELLQLFDDCTRPRPRDRIQSFREICDRLTKVRASLANTNSAYDTRLFLEQMRFNLGGDLKDAPVSPPHLTLRSRSGQTELFVSIVKDSERTCGIDATLMPNQLIMQGHSSSDVRTVINQRIDSVLQAYGRDHSTERRGAKGGAFETTIRIDHLSKDMAGVLKGREIISRVIDVLEQS